MEWFLKTHLVQSFQNPHARDLYNTISNELLKDAIVKPRSIHSIMEYLGGRQNSRETLKQTDSGIGNRKILFKSVKETFVVAFV